MLKLRFSFFLYLQQSIRLRLHGVLSAWQSRSGISSRRSRSSSWWGLQRLLFQSRHGTLDDSNWYVLWVSADLSEMHSLIIYARLSCHFFLVLLFLNIYAHHQPLHTIRWRARWTANSTWWELSVTLRLDCHALPTRWPMTWHPPWRRRTYFSPDRGRQPSLSVARLPTRSTFITNVVVRQVQVYLLVYLHRRYVEDYRIDFSRNYFLILFFSYFSIFQCRNNQVIYAEARGMTSKTKEPSTSSWLRCTQPLIGTGSTGHLDVFVWLWPPTSHPGPRRWRRPIITNSIRRIITFHLSATAALTAHL